MPRPVKRRRVCQMPEMTTFGPKGKKQNGQQVILSVDEYETIRHIDFEGLSQAECAERMDVGRTTIQSIYTSARKKLSQMLVEGKTIEIQGGQYNLCNRDQNWCRGCRRGRGHQD